MVLYKKILRKRRVFKPRFCFFCKQKMTPDYKEIDTLNKCISERGKILSTSISGICQKHQRVLAKEVKRARFLAFLPYVVRPS